MKFLLGLGALAALMSLPIWKDLHHRGESQSGWSLLWDQLVLKERAKHIHVEEAARNAKARHSAGMLSGGG